MRCPECGCKVKKNATMCEECGARFKDYLLEAQREKLLENSIERAVEPSSEPKQNLEIKVPSHSEKRAEPKLKLELQKHSNRPDGPFTAIWRYWTRMFDFKSRATRAEFNYPLVILIIFMMLLRIMQIVAGAEQNITLWGAVWILSIIVVILNILPMLSLIWRRFNDSGDDKSLLLLLFMPFVGLIIVLCFLSIRKTDSGRMSAAPISSSGSQVPRCYVDTSAQGSYGVKLLSVAPNSVITTIKLVRVALGIGLAEAKNIVDSAPVVLINGISLADANSFINALKQLGDDVDLIADD